MTSATSTTSTAVSSSYVAVASVLSSPTSTSSAAAAAANHLRVSLFRRSTGTLQTTFSASVASAPAAASGSSSTSSSKVRLFFAGTDGTDGTTTAAGEGGERYLAALSEEEWIAWDLDRGVVSHRGRFLAKNDNHADAASVVDVVDAAAYGSDLYVLLHDKSQRKLRIYQYSVASGKLLRKIKAGKADAGDNGINSASASQTVRLAASRSHLVLYHAQDRTVRVLDRSTGSKVRKLKLLAGKKKHRGRDDDVDNSDSSSAAIAASSRYVAVSCFGNNKLAVVDLEALGRQEDDEDDRESEDEHGTGGSSGKKKKKRDKKKKRRSKGGEDEGEDGGITWIDVPNTADRSGSTVAHRRLEFVQCTSKGWVLLHAPPSTVGVPSSASLYYSSGDHSVVAEKKISVVGADDSAATVVVSGGGDDDRSSFLVAVLAKDRELRVRSVEVPVLGGGDDSDGDQPIVVRWTTDATANDGDTDNEYTNKKRSRDQEEPRKAAAATILGPAQAGSAPAMTAGRQLEDGEGGSSSSNRKKRRSASASGEADQNGDDDEEEGAGDGAPTIAERLAQLRQAMMEDDDDDDVDDDASDDEDGEGKEKKNEPSASSASFQPKQATTESLTQLLHQSLQSGQDSLLELALSVRDTGVVRSSCTHLEEKDAELLLTALTTRLATKPARADTLVVWITSLLQTNKVRSLRHLQLLQNLIEERVQAFPALLKLEGRLNMMSSSGGSGGTTATTGLSDQ